jgi:hypothetical protein
MMVVMAGLSLAMAVVMAVLALAVLGLAVGNHLINEAIRRH